MPPPVLIPTAAPRRAWPPRCPTTPSASWSASGPARSPLVLKAQTSLHWDLGETNGTVALRVPDHEIALELLGDIGPMAVTSANLTGDPRGPHVDEAAAMLGESVAVYLDGGPAGEAAASTIIDCTGETPVTLRLGALSQADIDTCVLEPEPIDPEPIDPVDARCPSRRPSRGPGRRPVQRPAVGRTAGR